MNKQTTHTSSPSPFDLDAPSGFRLWIRLRSTLFCRLCGVVLMIFAGAKFISVTSASPILMVREPVFELSYRWFLIAAGTFEWVIALALFKYGKLHQVRCLMAIAFFCLTTWLYRVALNEVEPRSSCPCLGTLTEKIGITPSAANSISFVTLLLFSAGSVVCLISNWLTTSPRSSQKAFKDAYLFVLIGAFALHPHDADGQAGRNFPGSNSTAIRIEGSIRWKGSINGDPIAFQNDSRFQAILANCEYRIEEIRQWNGFGNQWLTHDGTNWYFVITFSERPITNLVRYTDDGPVTNQLKKPMKSANPATVMASPALEPLLPNTGSVLPLWLAFGAGCHFRDETSNRIPPLYFMGSGQLHAAQRVRADRELTPDGMFLRHYTDYWDDDLFPTEKYNCNGLTNIGFRVTGFTNLSSLAIPVSFHFVRYYFSARTTPNYFQSMDAVGTVDRVEIVNHTEPFAAPSITNMWVIHHPTPDASGLTKAEGYLAKDAQLKEQTEVDAGAAIGRVRDSRPRSYLASLRVAIVVTAMLVISMFLLRKWRAKGQAS